MPRRRTAGEGTVYQTKNGRWAAMLELPRQPNGKRHRKLRRARTQTEAKRLLVEMRREYEATGKVAPKNRMMSETIADHLAIRLASKVGRKTLERDRLYAKRMTVFFSNRRTSELTVSDCDELLKAFSTGELLSTGQPPTRNYITRARSFLINALTNDMRKGYISRNVAELAVVPDTSVESKSRRALTVEEWNALHDQSSGLVRFIVDLGGRHGLRPQEIRSVVWNDIDLQEGILSVLTQQSSYDEQVDAKTDGSYRTIELHQDTLAELCEWRATQERLTLKAGLVWDS